MDRPNDRDFETVRRGLCRAMAAVCPPWLASEAEDLVQRALMRLVHLDRQGSSGPWSYGYLRQAAYSQVVDEIRRRRRRGETSIDDLAAGAPPIAAPDPEGEAFGHEVGRALERCIEKLIEPRRRALALWLVGHPNREIAARLGWNAKRAENLVTRARRDVRRCLEKRGVKP